MIYVGSDHGGFELKEQICTWLISLGYQVTKVGSLTLDPGDDYPPIAFAVGKAVAKEEKRADPWGERAKGILLCRSAAGVTMAANKVRGIRAAVAADTRMARINREKDDINILTLSADWISSFDQTKEIVEAFLTTEYSRVDRHERRLAQIAAYELTN